MTKILIPIETKGAKKAQKEIKGVGGGLKSLAKKAGLAAAAYMGTQALVGAVRSSIEAFAEQEMAQKKLETVLKSTGNQVGMTTLELKALATTMSAQTKFSDEAIMGVEALALTFTQIGKEVMPDTIETILNMSEAMGTNLKEQTIQLAKALNDPIKGVGALQEVGVTLTAQQKDMVQSFMDVNDIAGAQKVILDELQVEFGGMAKAGGDTLSGALAQMSNAVTDAAAAFGNLLGPAVQKVAGFVKSAAGAFTEWFKELSETPLETTIREMNELGMETSELNLLLAESQSLDLQLEAQIKGVRDIATIHAEVTNQLKLQKAQMNDRKAFEQDVNELGLTGIELLNHRNMLQAGLNLRNGEYVGTGKRATQEEINLISKLINRSKAIEEGTDNQSDYLETLRDELEIANDLELSKKRVLSIQKSIKEAGQVDEGGMGPKTEEQTQGEGSFSPSVSEGFYETEQQKLTEHQQAMLELITKNIVKRKEEEEEERMSSLDEQLAWVEANIENEGERLALLAQIKEEHRIFEEERDQAVFDSALERASVMEGKSEEEIAIMLRKAGVHKSVSEQVIASMQNEGKVMSQQTALASRLIGFANKEKESSGIKHQIEAAKETFITTKALAVDAYKAFASIPFIGPALGAIAAGIVMAYGLKQVADIKSAATGADFITNSPQLLMVGDNPTQREHVQVTPIGSKNTTGPRGGANITLNITGNILSEDYTEDVIIPHIQEALKLGDDIR